MKKKKRWLLNTWFHQFTNKYIYEYTYMWINAGIMTVLCKPAFNMLGLANWHKVIITFTLPPRGKSSRNTNQIQVAKLIKKKSQDITNFLWVFWDVKNYKICQHCMSILDISSAVKVLTYQFILWNKSPSLIIKQDNLYVSLITRNACLHRHTCW